MRNYELICIFQPEMEEAAFNAALEKIQGWVGEAGGSVDKTENWGRRKLAYAIRKQSEGLYVLLNITLEPKSTGELERNIRFLEPVLRHMLTVM